VEFYKRGLTMNTVELFIQLKKQIEQVNELILRMKIEHDNVKLILELIEKINKKLDKKEK